MSNDQPRSSLFNEILMGSILFYFLLHSITTLVESIYLLDLLNTQLDEKVLGLLFFFTTPILLLFHEDRNFLYLRITGIGFVISRVIYPFFSTGIKILIAGLSVGFGFLFYPLYLYIRTKSPSNDFGMVFSNSVGLGILFSVLFRSLNSTWDISEVGIYRYIPLLLGLLASYLLLTSSLGTDPQKMTSGQENTSGINLFKILGLFCMIILIYFVYGTPAVVSRWADFPYPVAIALGSIALVAFITLQTHSSKILEKLQLPVVFVLNILFFSSLLLMILINQSPFLEIGDPSPFLVDTTPWFSHVLVVINLVLSPVLLINLSIFVNPLQMEEKSLWHIVSCFLVSELVFVIIIFVMIFTNVWGYVEPVSQLFRGLFWLPFLVLGLISLIPIYISRNMDLIPQEQFPSKQQFATVVLVSLISVTSILSASLIPAIEPADDPSPDQLRVLTYNIQQGANISGDKNYVKQLELIKEINPDIIGIQESDIAKINTANIDIVRYFSDNLGYYSYYGPKTVMQTYGVALLSRYPITNPLTFYTAGSVDEIGSIRAQVIMDTETYTVFVNHPAGSDESKSDHVTAMLDLAEDFDNVILMGDFNWRFDTQFYSRVNETYIDTWRTLWPTGVDDKNLNMSRAIDHIFVSPSFSVIDATYIPSPHSQTDHPAYWVNLENQLI